MSQGETMNRQNIRVAIIAAILGVTILATGYRLSQPEPELVSADAEVVNVAESRSLVAQATTIEEKVPLPAEQMILYTHSAFDYHLDYPRGWDVSQPATNRVLFESPEKTSRVEVEAVGPLPVEELAAFVERSIGETMVISHQTLTIHNQPAERIVAYSEELGTQETSFFIAAESSAVVITGVGEQRPIEMIARSFNGPQAVALR